MTIDGVVPEVRVPQTQPRIDTGAAQGSRALEASDSGAGTPRPSVAASDQAELSAEVRDILSQEAVPSGTLAPERLQEVLGRLTSGEYDSPEALDSTAKGLISDLRSTSEE